jgi:hypothetical protein
MFILVFGSRIILDVMDGTGCDVVEDYLNLHKYNTTYERLEVLELQP